MEEMTVEQVERKILDFAGKSVKKPGEVFNTTTAQMNAGAPAETFNAAVNGLMEKGYIEKSGGVFLKITETGFKAI